MVSTRTLFDGIRRFKWLPALLLIIASFAYVGVKVPTHQQFSPYDEYVYLDYLDKVPTQLVVHEYEKVGDYARNEISCRGVLNYGSFGQGCNVGSHNANVDYPYAGNTGADIYSPAYFAVTWVFAQPLTWLGLDLLDAGRLVGALWLAAGLLLLYGAMRELGAGRAISVGINLFVMMSSAIYWADTYLSTDAPSLAISAGLLLMGIRIAKHKMRAIWLVPAAAIAVLFKVQNLAAVVLVSLALIGVSVWDRYRRSSPPPGRRGSYLRPVAMAMLAVVAGGVAQAGWLAIRTAIALPPVVTPGADLVIQRFDRVAMVTEGFKYLFKVGFSDIPSGVTSTVATNVLAAIAIAGAIGLLVTHRVQSRISVSVAVAALVVSLLLGPALAGSTVIMTGQYFPLPIRYGIVLIPAFAVCAAVFFSRSRRLGAAFLVVGLAMAAVVIVV
ncbi:MAG: hypothetical protein QOI70_1194 [Microbacteriaceae bacterium]|jgi:hypothetical protein|nr:hypothetical protein [Microbacteriaceae bacterium]